jgi:hypothetical protein
MNSAERAAYEMHLSGAARHVRFCADILRRAWEEEAADQFRALEAWLAHEMKSSLGNRRPARITPPTLGGIASTPDASALGSS